MALFFISVNLTILLFWFIKSERFFLFSFDFSLFYFIILSRIISTSLEKLYFCFITMFDIIAILFLRSVERLWKNRFPC